MHSCGTEMLFAAPPCRFTLAPLKPSRPGPAWRIQFMTPFRYLARPTFSRFAPRPPCTAFAFYPDQKCQRPTPSQMAKPSPLNSSALPLFLHRAAKKYPLYLASNLICTKARTLCVPGLEFLYVPGLECFIKTYRIYYVLVFFGGTPKNGETTGQRYICQQEVNPSSSK